MVPAWLLVIGTLISTANPHNEISEAWTYSMHHAGGDLPRAHGSVVMTCNTIPKRNNETY